MSEAPTKPPGLNEASRAFLHNWEPTKRHDRPLTEGGKQFELVTDFAVVKQSYYYIYNTVAVWAILIVSIFYIHSIGLTLQLRRKHICDLSFSFGSHR